jgi:phosphatidate cytidylyltransferase
MNAVSDAPSAPQERSKVRRPSSLTLRVLSGMVLIPFLLGLAYFGGPAYAILICAATAFAAFEVRGMLRHGGYVPIDAVLIGLAAVLPLDAWLRPASDGGTDDIVVVVVVVLLSLSWMLVHPTSERALVDWALSIGLALYLGGLMQFYMPLRRVASDVPGLWVMGLLLLSWACDSSAYFVGGAFGRTRLAPTISPKKSVEGAVAGLVGACVAGVLLGLVAGRSPVLMGGYGLAIGVATIVGDLVESLLKRQMGAKDSGVLIPGHGGLLDRMDSLLFCAPVAVFYLHLFAT